MKRVSSGTRPCSGVLQDQKRTHLWCGVRNDQEAASLLGHVAVTGVTHYPIHHQLQGVAELITPQLQALRTSVCVTYMCRVNFRPSVVSIFT